jgi:hypothetical protein
LPKLREGIEFYNEIRVKRREKKYPLLEGVEIFKFIFH